MSTEKANEYAIESLKQIITLASAILVLTITFLKDLLGNARGDVDLVIFVPLGWACLFIGIWLALMTIIGAADALGNDQPPAPTSPLNWPPGYLPVPPAIPTVAPASPPAKYVFKKQGAAVTSLWQFLITVLSWFIPIIPTRQTNENRKLAASAQHYFVLGLLFLGLFGLFNLDTALGRGSQRLKPVNASAQFVILPTFKIKPATAPPPSPPPPARPAPNRGEPQPNANSNASG